MYSMHNDKAVCEIGYTLLHPLVHGVVLACHQTSLHVLLAYQSLCSERIETPPEHNLIVLMIRCVLFAQCYLTDIESGCCQTSHFLLFNIYRWQECSCLYVTLTVVDSHLCFRLTGLIYLTICVCFSLCPNTGGIWSANCPSCPGRNLAIPGH